MNNENRVNEVVTVEIEEVGTELEKLDLDLEQNDLETTLPDWAAMKISNNSLDERAFMSLVSRTNRMITVLCDKKEYWIESRSRNGRNPKAMLVAVREYIGPDRGDGVEISIHPQTAGETRMRTLDLLPQVNGGATWLPHRFFRSWEQSDGFNYRLADSSSPLNEVENIIVDQILALHGKDNCWFYSDLLLAVGYRDEWLAHGRILWKRD